MSGLDLGRNPFALLGLTPRSDRATITEAYEEKSGEAGADEALLLQAQQALMASKPRLAAELSWLTGLAPQRARECIGLERLSPQQIDTLPPLAASNLVADRLKKASPEALPHLLQALIAAQRDLSPARLAEIVNAERQISGFPRVDIELVAAAYEALRAAQVAAVVEAVARHDKPGAFLERAVEPFLKSNDRAFDFLEQLVEAFDRRFEPDYARISDALGAAEEALRREPKDKSALEHIDRLLSEWDGLNQARQLVYQAKGLNEPRSDAVYKSLRNLSVELANERQAFRSARHVSEALKRTFPELPTALPQLKGDLETLEGLIEQQEESEESAPYFEALERFMLNAGSLGHSLGERQFRARGEGLAGSLWRTLKGLLLDAKGEKARGHVWDAMLAIVFALGKEKKDPHRVLILVDGLLSFVPPPPEESRKQLGMIHDGLKYACLQADLEDAVSAKNAGEVNRLASALLEIEEEPERRKLWRRLIDGTDRATAEGPGLGKHLWWVLVAAGVLLFIANASDEGERRNYVPPPRQETAAATASSRSSSSDIAATGSLIEAKPPRHDADYVMSRDQLRYCYFNASRIEAMRDHTNDQWGLTYFNRRVDEWSDLCGQYRYYEDDLAAVKREALARSVALAREGREQLSRHNRAAAGSSQVDVGSVGSGLLDPNNQLDAASIQERLKVFGFYTGTVDGIWGSGSRAALVNFKAAVGLAANDVWSAEVQRRLFGQ